jgi:hypothetical protein
VGPLSEPWSRDPEEAGPSRPAPIVRAFAFREGGLRRSSPDRGSDHIARNADADTDTLSVCPPQIVTIKWLTARIAPRRYGEKVVPDVAVKVLIGYAIEKGREMLGG